MTQQYSENREHRIVRTLSLTNFQRWFAYISHNNRNYITTTIHRNPWRCKTSPSVAPQHLNNELHWRACKNN